MDWCHFFSVYCLRTRRTRTQPTSAWRSGSAPLPRRWIFPYCFSCGAASGYLYCSVRLLTFASWPDRSQFARSSDCSCFFLDFLGFFFARYSFVLTLLSTCCSRLLASPCHPHRTPLPPPSPSHLPPGCLPPHLRIPPPHHHPFRRPP